MINFIKPSDNALDNIYNFYTNSNNYNLNLFKVSLKDVFDIHVKNKIEIEGKYPCYEEILSIKISIDKLDYIFKELDNVKNKSKNNCFKIQIFLDALRNEFNEMERLINKDFNKN